MKTRNMNFGEALEHLQGKGGGYQVTRAAWEGSKSTPLVKLQVPDENSFMTEPYLYMQKFMDGRGQVRFPLDLSCESILAKDWMIII